MISPDRPCPVLSNYNPNDSTNSTTEDEENVDCMYTSVPLTGMLHAILLDLNLVFRCN